MIKVSDAITQFLITHKIQICFELVGGMITHLLDSFASSEKISIISMHHEQAAAFAAEGVSRQAKGKSIGVAMGTSGPGATNLITGIGSCWFDSIPCLFITGQVNTQELKGDKLIRQQGFQELDIVEVVQSLTKYAVTIKCAEEVMPELHKAISLIFSGRKGPVLIDIPNNIQYSEISEEIFNQWINKPLNIDPIISIEKSQLIKVYDLCQTAKRPLICIGGGARWADDMNHWLASLEVFNIPYVSTLMGHERVISNKNYYNMIGSYGNREANWAVQNCDLFIAIGCRLDVRQTGPDLSDFARNSKIIQVDIDPHQLNNRVKADLSICSSAEIFFTSLIVDKNTFSNIEKSWISILQQKKFSYQKDEYKDWKISPSFLFNKLNNCLENVAVDYICDVGNHQMWAANCLRLTSQQAIHYSGGMGAMGFALPVAIGVAMQSNKKAVVITGDGSIQINIQELDTLKRLNLDITIIVLNNFSLGMVKNFQDIYFNGRDQSTKKGYSTPVISDISKAYGISSYVISDQNDFVETFEKVFSRSGPVLIEIIMENATECRPRLSYGSKLDEQLPKLIDL